MHPANRVCLPVWSGTSCLAIQMSQMYESVPLQRTDEDTSLLGQLVHVESTPCGQRLSVYSTRLPCRRSNRNNLDESAQRADRMHRELHVRRGS